MFVIPVRRRPYRLRPISGLPERLGEAAIGGIVGDGLYYNAPKVLATHKVYAHNERLLIVVGHLVIAPGQGLNGLVLIELGLRPRLLDNVYDLAVKDDANLLAASLLRRARGV